MVPSYSYSRYELLPTEIYSIAGKMVVYLYFKLLNSKLIGRRRGSSPLQTLSCIGENWEFE